MLSMKKFLRLKIWWSSVTGHCHSNQFCGAKWQHLAWNAFIVCAGILQWTAAKIAKPVPIQRPWMYPLRLVKISEVQLNCYMCVSVCPLTGNVWIYRSYGKFSTDHSSPHFCHPVLYSYAFWLTTSTYIFLALSCCFICITGSLCGRQGNNGS